MGASMMSGVTTNRLLTPMKQQLIEDPTLATVTDNSGIRGDAHLAKHCWRGASRSHHYGTVQLTDNTVDGRDWYFLLEDRPVSWEWRSSFQDRPERELWHIHGRPISIVRDRNRNRRLNDHGR
jgi:hypothetical protein